MNGYEKLRLKNKEIQDKYNSLFRDFLQVIDKPDTAESLEIISRVRMEKAFSDMAVFGQTHYSSGGLLEMLAEQSPDSTFKWMTKDDLDDLTKKLCV